MTSVYLLRHLHLGRRFPFVIIHYNVYPYHQSLHGIPHYRELWATFIPVPTIQPYRDELELERLYLLLRGDRDRVRGLLGGGVRRLGGIGRPPPPPPLLSLPPPPPKRGGEGRHLCMGPPPPRRIGERRGIRGTCRGVRTDCAVTS